MNLEKEIEDLLAEYGCIRSEAYEFAKTITQHIVESLPKEKKLMDSFEHGFNSCLTEIKKKWGING